jgi:transposase
MRDIIYTHCAGLDVHKKTVVACRLTRDAQGKQGQETRPFATMTQDLPALSDWLQEAQVTQVALESSGAYWKPVYNLLEENFTLLLVNARPIKAVPGRKTDVKDAEGIAPLLEHGLLRARFVPAPAQRERRDLCRPRSHFIRERATRVNRVQKVLEGSPIKLARVATDVMGVCHGRLSWAFPGARCRRRSAAGKQNRACRLTWLRAVCAASAPNANRRFRDGFWPPNAFS